MPCAQISCKEAFQPTKGISCDICDQLYHRKCVKQSKSALSFVCSGCKKKESSVNTSDITSKSSEELLLSEIKLLKEEILSLQAVIKIQKETTDTFPKNCHLSKVFRATLVKNQLHQLLNGLMSKAKVQAKLNLIVV